MRCSACGESLVQGRCSTPGCAGNGKPRKKLVRKGPPRRPKAKPAPNKEWSDTLEEPEEPADRTQISSFDVSALGLDVPEVEPEPPPKKKRAATKAGGRRKSADAEPVEVVESKTELGRRLISDLVEPSTPKRRKTTLIRLSQEAVDEIIDLRTTDIEFEPDELATQLLDASELDLDEPAEVSVGDDDEPLELELIEKRTWRRASAVGRREASKVASAKSVKEPKPEKAGAPQPVRAKAEVEPEKPAKSVEKERPQEKKPRSEVSKRDKVAKEPVILDPAERSYPASASAFDAFVVPAAPTHASEDLFFETKPLPAAEPVPPLKVVRGRRLTEIVARFKEDSPVPAPAGSKCAQCGTTFPGPAPVRCPECRGRTRGRAASAVRCPECGKSNPLGTKECSRCRATLPVKEE